MKNETTTTRLKPLWLKIAIGAGLSMLAIFLANWESGSPHWKSRR